MKVVWSPLALQRVQEIALFIATDQPKAAAKWVDNLFASVERLQEFPNTGRIVPELNTRSIREVIFGAYRVFYRVRNDVEILTVRRGSQLLRLDELEESGD